MFEDARRNPLSTMMEEAYERSAHATIGAKKIGKPTLGRNHIRAALYRCAGTVIEYYATTSLTPGGR